jgi:hypothetical protein
MVSEVYDPPQLAQDDREPKLPAWAQMLIVTLRRQAAEARSVAHRAVLDRNPDTSRVLLDPFGQSPIGLDSDSDRPWRTEIAFKVPTRGYENGLSKICVKLLPDGKGLDIRGDEALVIHPWVSNSIRIYPTER